MTDPHPGWHATVPTVDRRRDTITPKVEALGRYVGADLT
jgi:hypothetical protein